MSTWPSWQLRLPLLLAAVCLVLVTVIYDEVQRRPSASIDDLVPAGYSAAVSELPADRVLTMPEADEFTAALERPLFSPTRRAVTTPDTGMPTLTSADFSLIGVVISPDERVVLVKPRSGDALARLHEGDTLAGWLAVSIAFDRVVFRRGAMEEEILLDYNVPGPALPARLPEAETGSEQSLPEGSGDEPANGESQSYQSGNEAPESSGASDP